MRRNRNRGRAPATATDRFDELARPQTRYALEALQHVFARMPWGKVVEFSDGRRGRIEPFFEPRWRKGAEGSTELVEGGFDVKFLDGGHLEFLVTQSGWETPVRIKNPQAKLEHRDLVTGERVRPDTPGSMATGRYVMRIRPAPGEPFEVVEIDREDLDPAKDTFGVAKETYVRYREDASAQARERVRELKRMPTFERGAEPRIPGARATFDDPHQALDIFLDHNPSLWVVDWADAHDEVRDWMDRIQTTHRGKRLNETARGQEILEEFRGGPGASNTTGLHSLLLYMFGRAEGRRWDNVDWMMVQELVDIFAEEARRYTDAGGDPATIQGGIPSIVWLPPATGFHGRSQEFVESLDVRGQEYYRRYQASKDLYGLADLLKRLLRENRRCLSAEERRVVRSRIKTVERWAQRPDEMPEWACASFREPAAICDLLGINAEVDKLRGACELGYDPRWPLGARDKAPWEPGLGVLPEAAALAQAPPEDLDVPWETAANPRRLRERLKRR